MDLSIIIVTYNSELTIKDCLDSIFNTVKKHSFEIIISDNSPNTLTKDCLTKNYTDKKIVYIKNSYNVGFSKGNNVGVRKSKGKFILFLNPDTKVYERTIDGMVDFMKKNKDCGVSSCYVELLNGKMDQASHRGFPTPLRSLSYFLGLSKFFPKNKILSGYSLSYLDTSTTHEVDAVAGSFMMVSRVAGEKVGWWDEDYYFYGEDLQFCYDVKKKGMKVFFVPEFRALHLKGISSGIKKESESISKASKKTKKWATHHRFSAMEIFYDKNYKKKYPLYVNYLIKLGIKLKKFIS